MDAKQKVVVVRKLFCIVSILIHIKTHIKFLDLCKLQDSLDFKVKKGQDL